MVRTRPFQGCNRSSTLRRVIFLTSTKNMREEIQNEIDNISRTPELVAAEQRAAALLEQARLNEAILVADNLLKEIDTMKIASRFSTEKKVFSSITETGGREEYALDKTEEKTKREQLRLDLERFKNNVFQAVGALQKIVLDIEATKQEG